MANATTNNIAWATEEEVQALKDLAASLVQDGDLSGEDLETLSQAIAAQEEKARLTDKQRAQIQKIVSEGVEKYGSTHVGKGLKAFGVLSLLSGVATIAVLIASLLAYLNTGSHVIDSYQGSTTELVIIILETILFGVGAVLHVVLGARLLLNKRYGAANIALSLVTISVADLFLVSMTNGVDVLLLSVLAVAIFRVALSVYLSPSLARERRLASAMRKTDTKVRAESGTLGLDLDGKGYIKLDFFNIFWVFVVTCVLGLIVEVIWHMVVVDPGVYQDRRGLLFGPFSPIYGIGAVLMTVALNRFKNANLIITFIVCTIIGGAFEYAVSWWMEVSFGVIAWDYTGKFLNINGRTCLAFASMFGLLGLWWIKWALPRLLALINKIPWKVRYSVTAVCTVLMLFNIGMTLQALDCWQERVNGKPVVTEVQQFYAENFPNEEMQNRFQSMTITPQNK